MPIKVSCQHCGKQFSAWDDLKGKPVQCPKCQGRMIVPGGGSRSGQPSRAEASAGGVKPDRPSPGREARQEAPPPAYDLSSLDEIVDDLPSLDEMPVEAPPTEAGRPPQPQPPPTPAAPPRPAAKPAAARAAPRAVPQADEFDDSEDLPIECPHCGASMPADDDLCDACGYHRILKKVLDSEHVYRPDKSTGFERMLGKHITDSESPETVLLWVKLFGGLAGLALVALLLMCNPILGLAFLLLVGGLVAYAFIRSKGRAGSAVNRDPLSAALWSGLLLLQRAFGWRRLEWPFPPTRVLTMNDPGFTDDDLAELDNLEEFQTLDLERTQITNAGLVHLEGLKRLRFLVLRNTQVTAEGVERLQPKLRKTLIWR